MATKIFKEYSDAPVNIAVEYWQVGTGFGETSAAVIPQYIKNIKFVTPIPTNSAAASVPFYVTIFNGSALSAGITCGQNSEFLLKIEGTVA